MRTCSDWSFNCHLLTHPLIHHTLRKMSTCHCHIHVHVYTRILIRTHAHTHTRTRTHACTHTHICTHACTHTRSYALTHAHTHAHMHSRTHTHMHALSSQQPMSSSRRSVPVLTSSIAAAPEETNVRSELRTLMLSARPPSTQQRLLTCLRSRPLQRHQRG